MTVLAKNFGLLSTVKTFGCMGAGDFGTFVMERVKEAAPFLERHLHDPKKGSTSTFLETVQCDIVLLAVPPLAFEQTLRDVIPHLKPRATLVDVISVKMHTVELLKRHMQHGQYLATHPLFGRQSFIDNERNLRGLEIAICDYRMPRQVYGAVLDLLGGLGLGLKVVTMTPEEHDRGPGIEQLSTIYQGLVMKRAGLELNAFNIHTRSAMYYFRAMEIVRNDEELFRQIAKLNPFWPQVKKRLEAASREVFAQNGD